MCPFRVEDRSLRIMIRTAALGREVAFADSEARRSRPPVGERQESDRLPPHGIVTSMMAQGDNFAAISAARVSVVLRMRS